MIVRICSDVVAKDKVESYVDDLRRSVLPLYSDATGLVSVFILRRQLVAYGEVATVSTWKSCDAMGEFVRNKLPPSAASLYTVLRREALTYELLSCA
jgi:heme-degrading monooxygenase HmoA